MNRRAFLGASAALPFARVWGQDKKPDTWQEKLQLMQEEFKLPGLAVSVFKDGKVVAQTAMGVRKMGDETKVTVDDRFHLGSCTKSMTATLAGLFVQEKKLDWDMPLPKAFPDCADTMHEDFKEVTLKHLIQHRAGMTVKVPPEGQMMLAFHNPKVYPGSPREQRIQYAKAILKEKPEPAGKKFEYTNRGYILLGTCLERIANASWDELLTKKLFEPLGIKNFGFGPCATKDKVDQPWGHLPGKEKHKPIEPGPFADNPPFLGPAGTVNMTLTDWAKYLQLHLDAAKGKSKLLHESTAKWLHTPGFDGNYAGGWISVKRNWSKENVLSHGGTNGLNQCITWLAPHENFGMCMATNVGGEASGKACDRGASLSIATYLLGKT